MCAVCTTLVYFGLVLNGVSNFLVPEVNFSPLVTVLG